MSVVTAAFLAVVAGAALAGSGNPNGTGQPSQSCQSGEGPPGIFSMNSGFANAAVNVDANPKTLPNESQINLQVVSQYDVACYQVTTHS